MLGTQGQQVALYVPAIAVDFCYCVVCKLGIMNDHNMEEVEEEQLSGSSSSPPRKKIKTNGETRVSEIHLNNAAASSESLLPSSLRFKIAAHEGGHNSILFPNNSQSLISGGKDSTIKFWDTSTGTLTQTLQGFQGSVRDLAISSDNGFLIAGLTSSKICIWDLNSGQAHRALDGHRLQDGHRKMVCAVDIISNASGHYYIASAANDKLVNLWDSLQDHRIWARYIDSNCNAVCFTMDENIICSGHTNGKLYFSSSCRFMLPFSKVAAHTQPVTSVCPLRSRSVVLSSGRDNLHNLVDVRTMQICGKFKTKRNKVASNLSRTCVSPDDNFVAVGSSDGSVSVWSVKMGRMVNAMNEHSGPVLSCSWSTGMGMALASTDTDGTICVWS